MKLRWRDAHSPTHCSFITFVSEQNKEGEKLANSHLDFICIPKTFLSIHQKTLLLIAPKFEHEIKNRLSPG